MESLKLMRQSTIISEKTLPTNVLSSEEYLTQIFDERIFGYGRCDIEVPQHLRRCFSNFPPIFKITEIIKEDIGTLMKECAQMENILVQPRKMINSSFHWNAHHPFNFVFFEACAGVSFNTFWC